jgi:hypothetical protein
MQKLLEFCLKHTDLHNQIFLDEEGFMLGEEVGQKRRVPTEKLPFTAPLRRHYFEELQTNGFILSPHDWRDFYFRFTVTDAGLAFLAENKWWPRQLRAIGDNVLTIAVSVVTALLVAWIVQLFGPTMAV